MSLNRSLSTIFKVTVKYDIRTYQTDGCHANVILVLLLMNQERMTNMYQFSRCLAYFTLAATHCQQCIHRATKAKQQLFYLHQLMCCLAVSEKRSTQNDSWSNSSASYFYLHAKVSCYKQKRLNKTTRQSRSNLTSWGYSAQTAPSWPLYKNIAVIIMASY